MKNILIILVILKLCTSYVIIPIKKYDQDVKFNGTYYYNYETENGIIQKAIGDEKQVKGTYSYTSPEGEIIEMTYIADRNGFQPYGPHIPAMPDSVRRALEYIRTHPPYYKIDPYNKRH